MPKNEKESRPWLWALLVLLNIIGVAFPLGYYLQTDGAAQIFAAVVLVCAGIFLVIVDGVTALFANFDVNQL